ncbi:probable LRR receptor-like serine/threonine-protein kinase At4g36180 [Ricinus communis]|uniref:Serine-threonine protein kinase, plant-type, putative n=1 Tax=Ricinus communis TaxID=3988 RepID=B9RYA6_RICCO|nr:probable LRR receptor-like serine/threonine-protein kinase At4g36180 [Ricinus communis]EEF43615.1 serine-threonine protein kinase, plant-type, putative [Ricinus communis]|eukprot:XP_025013028.1 probable LRR receptor-like serine/threonine-protein kinase At4g36180 [Ricinus communis]
MIKFLLFFLFLLNSRNVFILGVTSPQDISALKAFKSSIKPSSIPSWSCLASWDFTLADPCLLPRRSHFTCGVTCSSDATRVTQLTLDPVGYSGQLTPLISQLTNLTILDLSDNNFFGSVPSSISSLINLQTLTLRFNSFSGSLPISITNLKSLRSLDLSHNSLFGYLPKSMNSMSSLRRLDLSYNKLTGSLPKLPYNLLELALKNNSLSGSLSKASFDGLTQLEVIELSENSFNGVLESWFFLLPALQQVDLANNDLTRAEISKPVNGNSDLVAVDLGFNKIEGNVPLNFADYPLLSSLSLRYNRLRGTIPLEFSQKKSLKRLFLDGNFLIGKPPSEFFAGGVPVTGSLGDNCLQGCPGSSQLCTPSQKPSSVCKQAYGRKGKPKS